MPKPVEPPAEEIEFSLRRGQWQALHKPTGIVGKWVTKEGAIENLHFAMSGEDTFELQEPEVLPFPAPPCRSDEHLEDKYFEMPFLLAHFHIPPNAIDEANREGMRLRNRRGWSGLEWNARDVKAAGDRFHAERRRQLENKGIL